VERARWGTSGLMFEPMHKQAPVVVPPAPPPSSPGRSRNLSAVRRRDTRPELELRSLLHSQGLRFRVDYPIRLPRRRPIRPDVVFTKRRLAVFVDSCFWHGCEEHGHIPTKNAGYWAPKLARNRQRDAEQTEALETAGWLVLRLWDHEHATAMAARIHKALAMIT
jgi:DNA mismatch endonuclease, patch repair protein